MRWQIYQRATGREVLQLDAPNHPAAIAAAKLTGLDGEAIGARAVVRTSVTAARSIFEAAIGMDARVRRIDVSAPLCWRWPGDRIVIEHVVDPGEPDADRWAIRSDLSFECYGRDGWEAEPSPDKRDEAFHVRCRWTFEEALRAVEVMRDEQPVAGGSS